MSCCNHICSYTNSRTRLDIKINHFDTANPPSPSNRHLNLFFSRHDHSCSTLYNCQISKHFEMAKVIKIPGCSKFLMFYAIAIKYWLYVCLL